MLELFRRISEPERRDLAPGDGFYTNPCMEGFMSSKSNESSIVYKNIPGFPGYRVGDDGSVWSCKNARWGFRKEWRKLKTTIDTSGYPALQIMPPYGKAKRFRVYRLVLISFVGHPPVGMEALHENGDRLDNRLCNLRWGTRRENCADTRRHGRLPHGETHGSAKLTTEQVQEIRSLYVPNKFGYKRLAKMFGVHMQTIVGIIKGTRWK